MKDEIKQILDNSSMGDKETKAVYIQIKRIIDNDFFVPCKSCGKGDVNNEFGCTNSECKRYPFQD